MFRKLVKFLLEVVILYSWLDGGGVRVERYFVVWESKRFLNMIGRVNFYYFGLNFLFSFSF